MRRLRFWCAAVVFAGSAVVLADDHTVLFDRDIDFSTFKTFLATAPNVTAPRQELKFPAIAASIIDAARAALAKSGLTEGNASADLALGLTLHSVDYGVGPYGRLGMMGATGRGGRNNPNGLTPAYTEAIICLDLRRRSDNLLIWRGVFHDREENLSKFAETLPKHAVTLLSEYPPRKAK